MEKLRKKYLHLLNQFSIDYKRYLYHEINWDDRFIIIKGQRGVGKTSMMLQYIQSEIDDISRSLYVSLDDIYFTGNSLSDMVEEFVISGGKYLFIDEIHRYPGWSTELKNIYDFYPDVKIVSTGSSAIAIEQLRADISRRASIYNLHTASIREYLGMKKNMHIDRLSLSDILSKHENISFEISKKIRPVEVFNDFMKYGSYPFIDKSDPLYREKLAEIVNTVIDTDIPAVENISFETRIKIKKLLYLISEAVPFKPNIAELSRKVGTSRDVLLKYLYLLSEAGIISLLIQSGSSTSRMQKPEKIYLNSPALMLALNESAERGTLRETFFMNQLYVNHKINSAKDGDFIVDDKYTFEVGGKNKKMSQIAGLENAFIVSDRIEYGKGNKIPVWLFGFLY